MAPAHLRWAGAVRINAQPATVRDAETRRASPGSCVQQVPGFPFIIKPTKTIVQPHSQTIAVAGHIIPCYTDAARLPSALSVGAAQTEKGGLAMRRLVFVLLVALALVLLSAFNAE